MYICIFLIKILLYIIVKVTDGKLNNSKRIIWVFMNYQFSVTQGKYNPLFCPKIQSMFRI